MKKNLGIRKLQLKRESIRNLSTDEAKQANGGLITPRTTPYTVCICYTHNVC